MSNSDKRKVSTDALETLGMIIDDSQKRDAIHLAVCPVVAKQDLRPGQDVGADGTTDNPVGIVDPFLKGGVRAGERFWLVIYPRQINSLRHVWSHPAFEDEGEFVSDRGQLGDPDLIGSGIDWEYESKESARKWLEHYVQGLNVRMYEERGELGASKTSLDEIIEVAKNHIINNGERNCLLRVSEEDRDSGVHDQFWKYFEIFTGTDVPLESRDSFFYCSC